MVSRAFSKKSSRQGLMTISSGKVCSATQAYSLAVFTPPLPLPLAAKTHGTFSDLQPRRHTSKSSFWQLHLKKKKSFQVSLVSSPLRRSSICMSLLDQRFPLDLCLLFFLNKGGNRMHLICRQHMRMQMMSLERRGGIAPMNADGNG